MIILCLEKEIVSPWKPNAEAATNKALVASNGKMRLRLRMTASFRIGTPSRRPTSFSRITNSPEDTVKAVHAYFVAALDGGP
jgi:hypothetical protein